MGCKESYDIEIAAREYYDSLKDSGTILGDYTSFQDACLNCQKAYAERTKGTFISKINKAVLIREQDCKVFIISSQFSDGKEEVYRMVYHKSGFTTVSAQ